MFFVQLATQPEWHKLQEKVVGMQHLQPEPTLMAVHCGVRTLKLEEEEVFRCALVGRMTPEEDMWTQPLQVDLLDNPTLFQLTFASQIWAEDLPLAVPELNVKVTAVTTVPDGTMVISVVASTAESQESSEVLPLKPGQKQAGEECVEQPPQEEMPSPDETKAASPLQTPSPAKMKTMPPEEPEAPEGVAREDFHPGTDPEERIEAEGMKADAQKEERKSSEQAEDGASGRD